MPKTKYYRTVSNHPRRNGWMNGTQTPIRSQEVFSLKMPMDWYDEVKEHIEKEGWTKQEWGDHVVAAYYGKPLNGEPVEPVKRGNSEPDACRDGTQSSVRNQEVFSLKMPLDWYDEVKEHIESEGWTKQEWGDHIVAAYYGKPLNREPVEPVKREKSKSDRDTKAKSLEKSEGDSQPKSLEKFEGGSQPKSLEKSEPDWEELKKEVLGKFKLGRQSATYKKINQALDMMIAKVSG
ncbi:hypothetical protein [Coleofasciculus sp.]|uniref:hypothetical protein n=1 Tax=Coleofasciculus sp. TaxID=3100458 RepID=UPI0039FB2855